ncbi:hypothetical protein DJ013_13155 [Arcticibacterium luteifluviistationis]|uniref:Uncharacterized protein n=1 Tax=Arcticibacterium luteifluviistationis TaxID=1784714 RepID=A0A2Z4GCN2_9BACT|nr:hypothetical protein DJ013_13155 [Arcticibacterium luteifluviistationis]
MSEIKITFNTFYSAVLAASLSADRDGPSFFNLKKEAKKHCLVNSYIQNFNLDFQNKIQISFERNQTVQGQIGIH